MMATKATIGGRDHFRDFDTDSPEYNEHYDEVNNALLEQCPVAESKVGIGYYVVSRQDDVRHVAQDWQTFSSVDGMYPNRPEGMPPVLPEEIDPPYHTNWRAALNRYFTVKKVMVMEEPIREQVTALIDDFVEEDSCDLIKEFAALVPGRVFFAVLLGAPLEDLDRMVGVVDDAVMGSPEVRGPAWADLHVYIEGYLKQRQKEPPRDDFIDAILVGVDQENGEPCSWDDKVNVATLFLSGAVGTTASAIGGMVRYLVLNPDVRDWLIENPDMHDKAIEEFLRLNSPVTILSRTATKDAEVAGKRVKEGDRVAVNYAAACRDPEVYKCPMDFDPERDQTQSAVFGLGPHRCIGSHLARLEIKVALQELLRRVPDISLQPGAELTYSTSLLRILDSLPVEFTPGKNSEGASA
jgi:cytochrome P450